MSPVFLLLSGARVSLLLLAALLAAAALRGRSAAIRRQVLAAGVYAALVVPPLSTLLPAWHVPLATAIGTTETASGWASTARPGARPPMAAVRPPEARNVPQPRSPGTPPSPTAWSSAAVAVWLAGVVVGAATLVIGLMRLAAVTRRATAIDTGPWAEMLDEIRRGDPTLTRVRLLLSDTASLLVAWGWRQPSILLPCDASSWDRTRIRVVLEHEAEHIRRGDWPLQIAAEVVRTFAWCNPLAWLAANRLRLESEHACDDAVIARGVAPAEYAQQLVALARTINRPSSPFPAPAMARTSNLERRVSAMLDERTPRKPPTPLVRYAIVAAAVGVTTALAAAQSPYASVSGAIHDQLGGTVPGVTVSLTQPDSGVKHEVRSNSAGQFELVGLVPGNYEIELWKPGFKHVHDSVQFAAGQSATRNVTLDVGTLEETMRVLDTPSSGAPASPPRTPASPKACSAAPNSGAIAPPLKLDNRHATYPLSLQGTGETGRVVLWATIDTDGTVRQLRTVEATRPEFEEATKEAVRQWRFSQTLLNCVPIAVEMQVTAVFDASGSTRLESDAASPR